MRRGVFGAASAALLAVWLSGAVRAAAEGEEFLIAHWAFDEDAGAGAGLERQRAGRSGRVRTRAGRAGEKP